MIRRPPRSTQSRSSAASDVYKRQAPPRTMDLRIVVAGNENDGCVDGGRDVLDVVPGEVARGEDELGSDVAQRLDVQVRRLFVCNHQYPDHPIHPSRDRPLMHTTLTVKLSTSWMRSMRDLEVRLEDGALWLRLNRPEQFNALTGEMVIEAIQQLRGAVLSLIHISEPT